MAPPMDPAGSAERVEPTERLDRMGRRAVTTAVTVSRPPCPAGRTSPCTVRSEWTTAGWRCTTGRPGCGPGGSPRGRGQSGWPGAAGGAGHREPGACPPLLGWRFSPRFDHSSLRGAVCRSCWAEEDEEGLRGRPVNLGCLLPWTVPPLWLEVPACAQLYPLLTGSGRLLGSSACTDRRWTGWRWSETLVRRRCSVVIGCSRCAACSPLLWLHRPALSTPHCCSVAGRFRARWYHLNVHLCSVFAPTDCTWLMISDRRATHTRPPGPSRVPPAVGQTPRRHPLLAPPEGDGGRTADLRPGRAAPELLRHTGPGFLRAGPVRPPLTPNQHLSPGVLHELVCHIGVPGDVGPGWRTRSRRSMAPGRPTRSCRRPQGCTATPPSASR